jgi:hypothetical protein
MRLFAVVTAMACVGAAAAAIGDETNLYTRSLAACVQAKQGASANLASVFVIKNIIVEDPTFFYPAPSQVGTIHLEYLDTPSLLKRFRQTAKPFLVLSCVS